MRVDVSAEAGEFASGRGGRLWVWAGLSGFSPAHADGLEVWFRAPAGRIPDVLEIGVRGRRHPRVEAYWDGCSFAL